MTWTRIVGNKMPRVDILCQQATAAMPGPSITVVLIVTCSQRAFCPLLKDLVTERHCKCRSPRPFMFWFAFLSGQFSEDEERCWIYFILWCSNSRRWVLEQRRVVAFQHATINFFTYGFPVRFFPDSYLFAKGKLLCKCVSAAFGMFMFTLVWSEVLDISNHIILRPRKLLRAW